MQKIREYSDIAAKEIHETLGVTPTDEQASRTVNIIEQAVIKVALDIRSQCVDLARGCDSADQIADEIRRANNALIANLSSLR